MTCLLIWEQGCRRSIPEFTCIRRLGATSATRRRTSNRARRDQAPRSQRGWCRGVCARLAASTSAEATARDVDIHWTTETSLPSHASSACQQSHIDKVSTGWTRKSMSLDTNERRISFYARQLYRQVLLRARISYGNSVRLSVCLGCHDPVPNKAQVR